VRVECPLHVFDGLGFLPFEEKRELSPLGNQFFEHFLAELIF